MRCCLMAESQVILGLLVLHIRGGCSLTTLLFFLMLVGTCCLILSFGFCVVCPTYRASHQLENSDYTTFLVVGTLSFLADDSMTLVL